MKMETELLVVTLNCWGLSLISKDRTERIAAIADQLTEGNYDFVFLQEVWNTEDYIKIKFRTAEVLPYSHYFHSGVIGSGLCIFSKSPLKSAMFHQWAVNGYMHKINHGDWFGGKGLGMAKVFHKGLEIHLYTAHLHAEYNRKNDEYMTHRITQAFDTAHFISLTSGTADVVITGGDLNTEPGDLAYRVFVYSAHLRDSYLDAKEPRSIDNLAYTCEVPTNSYTSPGSLKTNPKGKRIDYILHKSGEKVEVFTQSCDTPWPTRVNGELFSYSDHEAVVSRLKVVKSNSVEKRPYPLTEKKAALEEAIEICSDTLRELTNTSKIYIGFALFSIALIIFSWSFEPWEGFLNYLFPTFRVLLITLAVFTLFMGTIWNRMETNGILSGKLQMELILNAVNEELELVNEECEDNSGGDRWILEPPNQC